MKNLFIIIGLTLLASCGMDSKTLSPHGEDLPKETCATNWEFNDELNQCQPIPGPPPATDPAEPTTSGTSVDSELKSIVDEYVSRSNISLPEELTYIKLTNEYDGTNIIGGCITFTSGTKEIRIKESYWTSQSSNRKKSLMFHELGHCIEDLGHTANAGNGECLAQTKDNTAKVMDACTERYTDAYAVYYLNDWNVNIDYSLGFTLNATRDPWTFPYTWLEDIAPELYSHPDYYYYNLYNAYTMDDMFTRFFNK